jgi:hypothetical protein
MADVEEIPLLPPLKAYQATMQQYEALAPVRRGISGKVSKHVDSLTSKSQNETIITSPKGRPIRRSTDIRPRRYSIRKGAVLMNAAST